MPKDEGKKKAKKGGAPLKSKAYKVDGGKVTRLKSSCPKCGEGVFLADHKDRQHCGTCGYSRWKKE